VQPSDYTPIISVLDEWWGGRKMSDMLPRLFFKHFCETSFILKEDNQIVAFLIGFFSQSRPDEAYIHFVGVHPQYRKQGLGRELYEHFFTVMRQHQRRVVRCVTSPVNKGSISFHTRMGFHIEPGDSQSDGIAYHADHDGPGEHRVCFVHQT
jgi:GNAT superfamily N-acetyltransferase